MTAPSTQPSAADLDSLRIVFRGDDEEPTGSEYKAMAQLPDEELIGVLCNSKGEPDDRGKGVKRAAAEWAKRQGRGVLCSRDY